VGAWRTLWVGAGAKPVRFTARLGWGDERAAHQGRLTLRAAGGRQRAREAREIGLPVDRLRGLHGRLLVQRAGGIELFAAGMRVQPVIAHGVASRIGGVLQHAGEEALGGKGQRGALLGAARLGAGLVQLVSRHQMTKYRSSHVRQMVRHSHPL